MFISRVRLLDLDQLEEYVVGIPVVQYLAGENDLNFHSPVVVLVGENGVGKSTILEAIAVAMGFNSDGGSKSLRFANKWTVSSLHKNLVVTRSKNPRSGYFLRAESHYDIASYHSDDWESDLKDLLDMSHGQSVLTLLQRRLNRRGLFIFDEPEAGLSPVSQMALISLIDQAVAHGSQFILATHSPILPALPGAQILELSDNGVTEVEFDDVGTVQETREFLADPQATVRYLTSPD